MAKYMQQHSAGGVVVKRAGTRVQVLLIKPRGRDRWQLPKGNIDTGESPDESAVREVREEGGVDAEILSPLEPVTFFYQMGGQKFVKTVEFYLMLFRSGSPADHDDEVDDARWFPAEQAVETITFNSERKVIEEAIASFNASAFAVAS
ncbi:MAG TPA: NUDIX hydrolase [Chloroflexota bacterium]|nr:NUDIX hydrolase [Chloroflexota bacterium]